MFSVWFVVLDEYFDNLNLKDLLLYFTICLWLEEIWYDLPNTADRFEKLYSINVSFCIF